MQLLFHFTLVLLGASASSLPALHSRRDVQNTGFDGGPRHGLRLLEWYVKRCLDNNRRSLCDPTKGRFGFHQFFNTEGLLPVIDNNQYAYYTIGNLRDEGANRLPYNIRRSYDPKNPLTNKDRVLVKFNRNENRIYDLYISAHYDPQQTYRIIPDLVAELREDRG